MEKVFGNYMGVVIQNNDPEKRGRLKIFIPQFSANIIEGWYSNNKNKTFDTLLDSGDSQVNLILSKLKDILPWAESANPIVGEIGSYYFDAYKNKVKAGDDLNKTGHKPVNSIDKEDAYSEDYSVESYSKSPKGLFSIPKVGSKVWCFFEAGDLQKPVYFATHYNETDWNDINKSSGDYPENYENYTSRESPQYDETYKNKLVLSQRGGTVEITNTDSKEKISISQYNGSFKIWTNDKTKEYVVNDDYKLVENDKYLTVNNDNKETVKNNKTLVVENNNNETVEQNKTTDVGSSYTITVNDSYSLTVSENNISIKANSGNITLDADNIIIKGPVQQSGGNITSTNDVIASGISLNSHVHGGVDPGGSNTSGPS